MNRDPVVEEVHRTRQKLLNGCSADLDRLLDRVKAGEKNHHNLVVTNSPLPVKTYVMKETESLVRSILGTVPLFGTALNEAFFDLRARLKHERLERFIEDLAKNVHSLETEKIDTGYIHSEEFVDFLEDVLIRANENQSGRKAGKTRGSARRPNSGWRRYALRRSLPGSVDIVDRDADPHFG